MNTSDERRTALVTGGTSGIGLETALQLAEDGFQVVAAGRSEDKTNAAQTEYGFEHLTFVRADVRFKEDIGRLVSETVSERGPIDVLVNNAGRNGGGVTRTLDDALWDEVIETNLSSAFRLTREVLEYGGISGPHGRIICVSSTGGKQGVPLAAPYVASKAGVIGFAKALGLELAKQGITVNAVCPGFVDTPMAQTVIEGHAHHFDRNQEDIRSEFESRIPLGRYVRPKEVAAMISYLASPLADAVTAQALNICGGLGRH